MPKVDNQTAFEKDVRKALIDRNMSASALAEELKCSPSYLSDILKGYRIAPEYRKRICSFLGLPESDYAPGEK